MRSYRGACAALCCLAGLSLSDGLASPAAIIEPRAPVPRPLDRTAAAERAAACVTAADAALYAQHGAAVVRGVFDAACVAELRRACDEIMRSPVTAYVRHFYARQSLSCRRVGGWVGGWVVSYKCS
jgi:hypothetical protein